MLKDLDFATDRDVREEWAVPAYPVAPLALLKLASEQAIQLDKLRCWADAKHLVGSYVGTEPQPLTWTPGARGALRFGPQTGGFA